jgi:hypothetical protein
MDERLRRVEEEKKRLELKKKVVNEETKLKELKKDYEPTTFQRLQKAAAQVQARKIKIEEKNKEKKKKEGVGRGFGRENTSFGLGGSSPFRKK